MKKPHIWALAGIVALGAFLRFYLITEIPPGLYPDEAMNGNNALEALATGHFKVFYPENNGREGLFINIQALSLALFGATPSALRIVSSLFGTLTILGVYLVAKELFPAKNSNVKIPMSNKIQNPNDPDKKDRWGFGAWDFIGNWKLEIGNYEVALLAAFFTATSYWHLNFSRIGFRAIMVPFFATFAMYFLLKGLRKGRALDLIAAGLFTGLGLYTYIAFRFMAFVFAVPIVVALWQWAKKRRHDIAGKQSDFPREVRLLPVSFCVPCIVALYTFVVFATLIPLGLYFINHPQDFLNRADEVSVFAAASPVREFARSTGLTLQMFFYQGDCNWRHNFNCAPALHPLVALFFLTGIISLWKSDFHKFYRWRTVLLGIWTLSLMLPAALTRESIPHALRAIGVIPPVMLMAGLGAERALRGLLQWIERQKEKWPQYARERTRLRYELLILFVLVLLVIPLTTYRAYFLRWSSHQKTYEAFDASSYHLGQYLAGLPRDVQKYVAVNTLGVLVRGIPMPSQTVMFATDTFSQVKRERKNLVYLVGSDIADRITIAAGQKTLVALIDSSDRALLREIQNKYPELQVKVPGDFVVLQNY